jgi:hypothetical protein
MDLSGLLEITPVGLGTTIMCLALLAALGISKRGKRLIRASRTAHAPLGFVCILVSLVLVLVGTLILYAHKAVCQSCVVVLLPELFADFFFQLGLPNKSAPLVVQAISSAIWTAVIYAALRHHGR